MCTVQLSLIISQLAIQSCPKFVTVDMWAILQQVYTVHYHMSVCVRISVKRLYSNFRSVTLQKDNV
jgi:hypothetical protein